MLGMQEIANQGNLCETEVINAIIEGLRDPTPYTTMLYTATTVDELGELLVKYDRKRLNDSLIARRVSNPATSTTVKTDNQSDKNSMVRCYNCSNYGHYSAQCSQPRREIGSCFTCGSKDHQSKNCNMKRTVNTIGHSADDHHAEPGAAQAVNFYETVSVAFNFVGLNSAFNFVNYLSLIDSGSPTNFVSKEIVPIEMDTDIPVSSNLFCVNGIEIKTYGTIDCLIKLYNKTKIVSLFIVDAHILPRPLLFGRQFLNSFKITFCMDMNTSNVNFLNKNIETPNLNYEVFSTICGTVRSKSQYEGENNYDELYYSGFKRKIESNEICDNIGIDCGRGETDSSVLDLFSPIGDIDCPSLVDCLTESGSTTLTKNNLDHEVSEISVPEIYCIDIDNSNDIVDIDLTLPKNIQVEIRDIISAAYFNNSQNKNPDHRIQMNIRLTSDIPVRCSPRRLSYKDKMEIQKITDDLLDQGIIRNSDLPYASPIVLVKKKSGYIRMCIDYRDLNKITVRDNYPLPLIEDCLEYLSKKVYFSLLDLKSEFHQVKMSEQSIPYTSFVAPHGQFEYTMMPFGLKNAPSVFQRFISCILKDFVRNGQIIIYMDDILIATPDITQHLKILKEVLCCLAENSLEIKLNKCKFVYTSIDYLGYNISKEGINPNASHKESILNYPAPKNIKELHSFVGLASYFRKFVPHFSNIAKPLYDLLKKDCKFDFDEKCVDAYNKLKTLLIESPVLSIYDPLKETELHCTQALMALELYYFKNR